MTISVVVALPGDPREPSLVSALAHPAHRLHVARRCVEVSDLLAVCASGAVGAALVGGPLLPLDAGVIARLDACGVGVVGIASANVAPHRLAALGVRHVLPADASAADVVAALAEAERGGRGRSTAFAVTGTPGDHPARDHDDGPARPSTPARSAIRGGSGADDDGALAPESSGSGPAPASPAGPSTLVAVWGPVGAPGRTSVAAILAQEAARSGAAATVIDVDAYGPSLDQVLGLPGDLPPGLVSLVREAHRGGSVDAALVRLAVPLEPGLDVLTGLPRPDRWPELRPAALETVLDHLAERYRVVVADTGFCLEQDEELAYDTLAPRRNGAAVSVLARADRILAVAAAEPVGIRRLLHGLDAVAGIAPRARIDVVLNRAPQRGGEELARDVAALLAEHGHSVAVHPVADDPRGFVAWRAHGGTFAEHAPRSPVRIQVRRIVDTLQVGSPAPATEGRARRFGRRAVA